MKAKPQLVWDTWNIEHIKKHKVTVGEVEQAYLNEIIRAPGKKGRILVIGSTKKDRLITIFISYQKQPDPYVVSARDSSKRERSIVYEKN